MRVCCKYIYRKSNGELVLENIRLDPFISDHRFVLGRYMLNIQKEQEQIGNLKNSWMYTLNKYYKTGY